MRKTKEIGFKQIGKNKYKFIYDKELIVYKKMLGYRLTKNERVYVKKYEESCNETNGEILEWFDSYSKWSSKIKDKYSSYTIEQLEDLYFYLENGRFRNSVEVTDVIGLAVPVLAGVVLISLEDVMHISEMSNSFVVLLNSILMMILFGVYIFIGFKMLISRHDSEKMYCEYSKIIKKLIEEKSEENQDKK